jgi:hypothetical protein
MDESPSRALPAVTWFVDLDVDATVAACLRFG